MKKNALLFSTALVGAAVGVYGRTSYAACTAVGSVVTCTGSSEDNTTTQNIVLNNADVTADSGFGVNVSGAHAITITGDGALSFSDNNAVNTVDITASGGSFIGLYMNVTGDDGTTKGSATVYSNSFITSSASGLSVINDGSGTSLITVNGDINAVENAINLNVINSDAGDINLAVTSISTIESSANDGVFLYNNGSGITDITIDGDITAELDGMEVNTGIETTGIIITVGESSTINAGSFGITSLQDGTGTSVITVNGDVNSENDALHFTTTYEHAGDISVSVGDDATLISNASYGVHIYSHGIGITNVTVSGDITAEDDAIHVVSDNDETGDITLIVASTSTLISKTDDGVAVFNNGIGITDVTVNGDITAEEDSILVVSEADEAGDITLIVASTSTLISNTDDGVDVDNDGIGTTDVTVNGDITAGDNGITIHADASTTGVMITVGEESTISSQATGVKSAHSGTGTNQITVNGDITAEEDALLIYSKNNEAEDITLIVASTSTLISNTDDGVDIYNYGSGITDVTVNGDITAGKIGISIESDTSTTDILVNVGESSTIYSNNIGLKALLRGTGTNQITINGDITSIHEALYIDNISNNSSNLRVFIGSTSTIMSTSSYNAVYIDNNGIGITDVTINGDIVSAGDSGVYIESDDSTTGMLVNVGESSTIYSNNIGLFAQHLGSGSTIISVNGDISSELNYGISAYSGLIVNNHTLNIGSAATISSTGSGGISSVHNGYGDHSVTVNGDVSGGNRGIFIYSTGNASYTSLLVSSNATIESDDYGIYLQIDEGTSKVTVNGDVSADSKSAIFNNSLVDAINLNIGQDAVIRSNGDVAIDTNDGKVLNLTIDGATIIGTGGVAINLNDDDDNLNLAGTVNITGDVEAGDGTDTLSIATTRLNMSAGSSFLNFEDVDITGYLTSVVGSNVDIDSTTTINVTGGIVSDIASASSYGKVTASNGFTFSNTADISVTTSGRVIDITSGTLLSNILSGGTISGISSGVITDDNPLYIFTSIVNDDSVDILVTRPEFTNIGNENTIAIATILDATAQSTTNLNLQTIITEIVNESNDSEKERYLNSLLPDVNSSKFTVAKDVVKQSSQSIKSRVSSIRNFKAGKNGVSTGDVVNVNDAWFNFFNNDISQGYRDRQYGYDANVKGVIVGFNYDYSENTILGSSLSYANGDTTTRVLGSDSIISSKNIFFYASHNFNSSFYSDFISSVGLTSVENSRKLFDNTVAYSKYDGMSASFDGTIGFNGNYRSVNIDPYLSAKYTHVSFGDYIEDGSSAPLIVDDSNTQYLSSSIGIKSHKLFYNKNIKIIPNMLVAWEHELLNQDTANLVSLVGVSSSTFLNEIDAVGSDTFNFGFGLDIQTTNSITISFNYLGEVNKAYNSSNVAGGLKINF